MRASQPPGGAHRTTTVRKIYPPSLCSSALSSCFFLHSPASLLQHLLVSLCSLLWDTHLSVPEGYSMDRLKKVFGDLDAERSSSADLKQQDSTSACLTQSSSNVGLNESSGDPDAGIDGTNDHDDAKILKDKVKLLEREESYKFVGALSARHLALQAAGEKKLATQQARPSEGAEGTGPQSRRTSVTRIPSSTSIVLNTSGSTIMAGNQDSLRSNSSIATAMGDILLRAMSINSLESETVGGAAPSAISRRLTNRRMRRGGSCGAEGGNHSQSLACISKRGSYVCSDIIYRRRSSAGDYDRRHSSTQSISTNDEHDGDNDKKEEEEHGSSNKKTSRSSSSSNSHRSIGHDSNDSFSTLASIEAMIAKRNHRRA